ncbi:MAG: hypothetical protein BGO05_19825 [Rhizobiales bacterium 63-7]|nr:MAG: hypothetical protein BGO05_19825 [Rhizobiales bacterium 63-7]
MRRAGLTTVLLKPAIANSISIMTKILDRRAVPTTPYRPIIRTTEIKLYPANQRKSVEAAPTVLIQTEGQNSGHR